MTNRSEVGSGWCALPAGVVGLTAREARTLTSRQSSIRPTECAWSNPCPCRFPNGSPRTPTTAARGPCSRTTGTAGRWICTPGLRTGDRTSCTDTRIRAFSRLHDGTPGSPLRQDLAASRAHVVCGEIHDLPPRLQRRWRWGPEVAHVLVDARTAELAAPCDDFHKACDILHNNTRPQAASWAVGLCGDRQAPP